MINALNKTGKWQTLAILLSLAISALTTCQAVGSSEDDKFTYLLDMDLTTKLNMTSNSYSGYLPINDEKQLHYVFVESKNDPTTDPIILWFNGGPGCSSMLAFLQEHGPWVLEDGADSIIENPYPWNAHANLIYLESPAGVGFSPWNINKTGWHYNDMLQSEDAFKALQQWYFRFPQYGPDQQNNKIFISGESYGGIYTPYLAWQIYQNNQKAKIWNLYDPDYVQYNLGGIMVGNGATDWTSDVWPVYPELLMNFNIIPIHLYEEWVSNECIQFFNGTTMGAASCNDTWNQIMDLQKDLFWYDLYRENPGAIGTHNVDMLGNVLDDHLIGKTTLKDGRETTYKRGFTFKDYVGGFRGGHPGIHYGDNNITQAANLSDYLNQQVVKDILHINDDLYLDKNSTWQMCNPEINEYWHFQNEGSLWIYRIFYHQPDIKMLFFSGDTDGAVPPLGTRKWIEKLNWKIHKQWSAWVHENEVQGYIEHYRGHFSFATVHGVGHMAPQWKRAPMQYLITQWVHDLEIDTL